MMKGIAAGELAHVQFAQQHRSGLFQVGYDRGVVVGYEISVHVGAIGGADALGVELVLYGHRYAVHGPPVLTGADISLGLPGGRQSLFFTYGDVRVELAVHLLYAVQVGLSSLYGRNFPGLN